MTKVVLSDRQKAFVREYCVDFNATQAAVRAGYSEKTAMQQGSRLLSNVEIQLAVQDETKKQGEASRDIKERILEELALIAFSRLSDYTSDGQLKALEDIDADKIAAIGSIEVNETTGGGKGQEWKSVKTKFKLWSKEKALELLMRHHGMLNDKLQVDLPDPVVIQRRNGEVIELGCKKKGDARG